MAKFDFSGWATRANLRCSDGRTILRDAFKHNDGKTVPLVWNHQHNDPNEVLGHAMLENRDEGVYAYCKFNDTEAGRTAKLLVQHGDVNQLSIYANKLKQNMGNVLHGDIREVSLVLAGANPGAYIDSVMMHGEESLDEAVIFTGMDIEYLYHSDDDEEYDDYEENEDEEYDEEYEEDETDYSLNHSEEEDESMTGVRTIEEVFDTLNDEQQTAVYAVIGAALEEGAMEHSEGGDYYMKHNVFDQEEMYQDDVLSHSEMEAIFSDARRYGSLKDAALAHGIEDIEYLFPEDRNLNTPPEFIKREMGWVSKVMSGVHHSPFSRIKSMFADITEDDARAKGYIKGNFKKEEVFSLLKRSTSPTTIYKKQKIDRDDVIDITDFDVVSWLKSEMRMMLDEEIARAILVGDGRSTSSDDKINEQNIRPVWTDEDLFTIKALMTVSSTDTDEDKAKAFIKKVIKSRKDYKGSGEPTLFTTEDMLTDLLLIEDKNGRIIYDSVDKLKSALRVSAIVTVPVMEGLNRTNDAGETLNLMGIIVNLKDYNVGADKGGAVNMFDDFDIDYNAQKYLIETRCSGALIKPFSAIAIECKTEAVSG